MAHFVAIKYHSGKAYKRPAGQDVTAYIHTHTVGHSCTLPSCPSKPAMFQSLTSAVAAPADSAAKVVPLLAFLNPTDPCRSKVNYRVSSPADSSTTSLSTTNEGDRYLMLCASCQYSYAANSLLRPSTEPFLQGGLGSEKQIFEYVWCVRCKHRSHYVTEQLQE